MKSRKNFFIVGAPKCGTSALATYLSEHLHVAFSDPKEPHYFSNDLPEKTKVVTSEQYQAIFPKKKDVHIYGEGSVWYLYSKVAYKNIFKYDRDSKIIILIRDPKTFLSSMYNQNRIGGHEEESCFSEAMLKTEREEVYLNYEKLISYQNYIDNYINTFGRDNVLILLQEYLLDSPRDCYKKVLSFLDLPDDNRVDFPMVNKRRIHKSKLLKAILTMNFKKVLPYINKTKAFFGVRSFGLYKALMDFNSKHVDPKKQEHNVSDYMLLQCEKEKHRMASIYSELNIYKYWK